MQAQKQRSKDNKERKKARSEEEAGEYSLKKETKLAVSNRRGSVV